MDLGEGALCAADEDAVDSRSHPALIVKCRAASGLRTVPSLDGSINRRTHLQPCREVPERYPGAEVAITLSTTRTVAYSPKMEALHAAMAWLLASALG